MPTSYSYQKPAKSAGVVYRSYTEATWAQLFGELRIGFEYEPKTFKFPDSSLYTPDFYLPRSNRWIEVKNGNTDEIACEKANKLARHIGSHVILLDGTPKKSTAYVFDGRPAEPRSDDPLQRYAFDETIGNPPAAVVNRILQPSPYETAAIAGFNASRVNHLVKGLQFAVDFNVSQAEIDALAVKLETQRQDPEALAEPTPGMLQRYVDFPDRRFGSLAPYGSVVHVDDVF